MVMLNVALADAPNSETLPKYPPAIGPKFPVAAPPLVTDTIALDELGPGSAVGVGVGVGEGVDVGLDVGVEVGVDVGDDDGAAVAVGLAPGEGVEVAACGGAGAATPTDEDPPPPPPPLQPANDALAVKNVAAMVRARLRPIE
jgi:hypothetical protein